MTPTASAFPIISAVVAPALLILACSSLITTTANRLSLLLDRVRQLTLEMEGFQDARPATLESKRSFVAMQLLKGSRRARLLQRTLATLYLALGSLILTSIGVGVSAAIGLNADCFKLFRKWIEPFFGLICGHENLISRSQAKRLLAQFIFFILLIILFYQYIEIIYI